MKKNRFLTILLSSIIFLIGAVSFSACGIEPDVNTEPDNNTGSDYNDTQTATIDVDLTKLSSTMVYAEVNNMLYFPKAYIGKTIKMSGKFVVIAWEGQFYPAVLIADATACCAQGFEFLLKDKTYPNDYPKTDTEIVIVGTFETYYEGDTRYCHLVDAELL